MNAESLDDDFGLIIDQEEDAGNLGSMAFEWTNRNGVTDSYRGLWSALTTRNDYDLGGRDAQRYVSVECRTSEFDKGTPEHGDTLYHKGTRYRVVEIAHDPYGVSIQFTLEDEDN